MGIGSVLGLIGVGLMGQGATSPVGVCGMLCSIIGKCPGIPAGMTPGWPGCIRCCGGGAN
jgi:hypothetical protein